MYIVIAGAGRVGGRLASQLADSGHDVVIVDHDLSALDALGKSFNGIVIQGEAFDVDVLREAKTSQADFFCALTDDDNINLMASEVAKVVFGVRRVLSRLQDPAREESYRALDIPYISTTKLIASVILERITDTEFDLHITFGGGPVELVEFTLGEAAHGRSVRDIEVARSLRVAAIRRGSQTFIPDPSTNLAPGDLIVAAAHQGISKQIEPMLAAEQ